MLIVSRFRSWAEKTVFEKVTFDVTPKAGGASLGKGEITKFSYEVGSSYLKLPATLQPGWYAVSASAVDANGKTLASHTVTFERKDPSKFPWLGNNLGKEDVLPKLFSAVGVKGDVILGHKKEIRLNGCALPASIKAAGVDLLSGAVELRGTANGKSFVVKPATAKPVKGVVSKTQVNYTGSGIGGPVEASVSYKLEYDGTAKVTVKLSPTSGTARLDNLQLVIPFKGDAATHYMANGINMRQSNQAGYIPGQGKVGRVWDSTSVKTQSMTVGSFVPIVHVGNVASGITWFANSDEGWWPNDNTPAIEIDRTKDGNVELVLNIASEKVSFSTPREIVFGLCTLPTRDPSDCTGNNFTFGWEKESGRWDPAKNAERVYGRCYPDDIEKSKAWNKNIQSYGGVARPYIENSPADFWKDEYSYFEPEWSDSTFYPSATDNRIYWTTRWVKDAPFNGYYTDNVFNHRVMDPVVSSAYYLPDGRIQPGYMLWEQRDFYRRLRVTFDKYMGDRASIVVHNTDFQFAPVCCYADLAMGGENPLPGTGTPDFMDMWPRDWMDINYNQPMLGYKVSHLYHYGGMLNDLGEWDKDLSMKGHRTTMASMLVRGVEFFQGLNYESFLKARFQMFKAMPGKTEFIPSWKSNGLFKALGDDKDIEVALYKKDEAVLVIVTNYSKQASRAVIELNQDRLLPKPKPWKQRQYLDFETLEFPGWIFNDGPMKIDVAPRDFRAILIWNAPPAMGNGF
jgi:hypothetical protein